MSQTPHGEQRFAAGEIMRDIGIGMSGGPTILFALAPGLSAQWIATQSSPPRESHS
jgi:hypothetical protein